MINHVGTINGLKCINELGLIYFSSPDDLCTVFTRSLNQLYNAQLLRHMMLGRGKHSGLC